MIDTSEHVNLPNRADYGCGLVYATSGRAYERTHYETLRWGDANACSQLSDASRKTMRIIFHAGNIDVFTLQELQRHD